MVYGALMTDGIWNTKDRWYMEHLRQMVYGALMTDGIWSIYDRWYMST